MAVFVMGCALGLLSAIRDEVTQYTLMAEIDPHLMLHIFLPVLVFDSAYALETHTFLKSFPQVVLLAGPAFSEYHQQVKIIPFMLCGKRSMSILGYAICILHYSCLTVKHAQ